VSFFLFLLFRVLFFSFFFFSFPYTYFFSFASLSFFDIFTSLSKLFTHLFLA
jgi:hypothetical protein